jgi:hypothetical protein
MSDTFQPPTISRPPEPVRPASGRPATAAWLAIAGASLLLVASVVVVASRWQQIPQTVRFAGLLTAMVLIAALAEQIRRAAPTTATVIAHLVPGIAITVGIAAGATATQPWPVCILVGGLMGAVATEHQKRRWASPRMAIIGAAGLILAGCGVAGQSAVPAALLVAGCACLLLLFRRTIEATTMAAAVGASPLLAALTTIRFGEGTMTRIGAAGPVVTWAAPIAGFVAAFVLGVVARRQRSIALTGVAVASAVLNVVAGLAVGHAAASLWACLLPASVIAIELGAARSNGLVTDLCRRTSRHIAAPFSFLGLILPPLVIVPWRFVTASGSSDWSMPLALAGLAAAYIGARRLTAEPSQADAALAAAVGFSVAALATLGQQSLALTGVAMAGLVFCFAFHRCTYIATTVVSSGYVAFTLLDRAADSERWTVSTGVDLAIALAGGLLCVVVLLRSRTEFSAGVLAVVAASGAVAAIIAPDWRLAVATAAVAIVGSYSSARRSHLALPIAGITALTALVQIQELRWSSVVAILISAAVAFAGRRSPWLRLAVSSQLVAAGWLAVRVAGATPNGVVGWMIVAAIVLTGIAFSTPRLTCLDSAGLAATAFAGLSLLEIGVHPALISLTMIVGSAQGFVYGLARRHPELAMGSAVGGGIALVSLWFTTGANDTVLSKLVRYDFTGADLAALVISAAMLATGFGLRRWQGVSTWLAYGPGLALVSSWVIAVEAQRGADWATMAGILIGIVAIAIGGWQRLSAPLVIGTALLIATTMIASGSQLASLPGWSWLVLGGIALLGLAAALEGRAKSETEDAGGLKAMFERFN